MPCADPVHYACPDDGLRALTDCASARSASRSYLHHLYCQHEPLFDTLATWHNIAFMSATMANLRARILADDL